MKQTQKYLAEQERIAKIAFQLFAKTGYAKTPLSAIGKAAGVQKSLLQYYFPKKSKFIELYLRSSFNMIIDQVVEALPEFEVKETYTGPELARMLYDISYFEFWYITSCPSTEAIRLDVMENYNTAQLVVQCMCDWIFEHVSDLTEEMRERIYDTVTFCVGGSFEYACYKAQNNEPVDVHYIISNAIDFMLRAVGYDPSDFQNVRHELPVEWLLRTADAIETFALEA